MLNTNLELCENKTLKREHRNREVKSFAHMRHYSNPYVLGLLDLYCGLLTVEMGLACFWH